MLGGLMIIGGVVCISAMLLNEFGTDEKNWMFEMAKWLRKRSIRKTKNFGQKFEEKNGRKIDLYWTQY